MKKPLLKLGFGAAMLLLVSFFAVHNLAQAEYYNLPEPMVGQVTVVQGSKNIYGGYTGNEAIFNYDPNVLLGFSWPNGLMQCYNSGLGAANPCFTLDTTGVMNTMVGRTSINGMPATEVAALLWPENSIQGDAYSSGSYLNNFAFYGRNLNKSSGNLYGTGYTWGTGSYALNKEAQASYAENQKAYLDSRITLLNGEATVVASGLSGGPWYLQTKNNNIGLGPNDMASYPEGKVWKVDGNVTLLGTKTYRGKGTIIINGNLTLNADARIVPQSNSDFLGIIVNGNLTFLGKNKTQMVNFTTGNITVSNNYVDAIGSYAAKDFVIGSSNGVRFYYDFRLDSGWPPGFRYFNMPTAKNTAP